jgi:hypothetical protein
MNSIKNYLDQKKAEVKAAIYVTKTNVQVNARVNALNDNHKITGAVIKHTIGTDIYGDKTDKTDVNIKSYEESDEYKQYISQLAALKAEAAKDEVKAEVKTAEKVIPEIGKMVPKTEEGNSVNVEVNVEVNIGTEEPKKTEPTAESKEKDCDPELEVKPETAQALKKTGLKINKPEVVVVEGNVDSNVKNDATISEEEKISNVEDAINLATKQDPERVSVTKMSRIQERKASIVRLTAELKVIEEKLKSEKVDKKDRKKMEKDAKSIKNKIAKHTERIKEDQAVIQFVTADKKEVTVTDNGTTVTKKIAVKSDEEVNAYTQFIIAESKKNRKKTA